MNKLELSPILWPFIRGAVSLFRASAPLRPCVEFVLLFSTAVCVSGAEIPKAPVPKSPYIAVVYRYADTMLEKGRDTYGPQQTGLFLSALDRATLAPLTNRPAAPAGVRETDRVGAKDGPLVGANPQHDENLLRLLYLLTDLTTKVKYRDAANAAVKGFLAYDARFPVAESFRPWLLWDRCFELVPESSKAIALELARNSGMRSIRQTGFDLRALAAGSARTQDTQFLDAIDVALRRLGQKGDSPSGLKQAQGGDGSAVARLSLAIDCDGASHQVPGPVASRLRAFAALQDEAFCTPPHDLKRTGGFVAGESHTPRWNARYGGYTTAQLGMMCVSRYDNTGKIAFRNLLIAAADAYLDSLPADGEDVWPGTFGHVISLQVAAWRHSAKPVYFERARKFADIAIEKFFGTNALPRASFQSEHYESITGADTLALALTELHLQVLHITAVRCPPNTIDR